MSGVLVQSRMALAYARFVLLNEVGTGATRRPICYLLDFLAPLMRAPLMRARAREAPVPVAQPSPPFPITLLRGRLPIEQGMAIPKLPHPLMSATLFWSDDLMDQCRDHSGVGYEPLRHYADP